MHLLSLIASRRCCLLLLPGAPLPLLATSGFTLQSSSMGTRVYVGGLREGIEERELESEFARYGQVRSIWVARKPSGEAASEVVHGAQRLAAMMLCKPKDHAAGCQAHRSGTGAAPAVWRALLLFHVLLLAHTAACPPAAAPCC